MGSKGYFVKIPRELEQKIKSWLNEEIYVLLLPVSELSRQQVIVKTGEEHGD